MRSSLNILSKVCVAINPQRYYLFEFLVNIIDIKNKILFFKTILALLVALIRRSIDGVRARLFMLELICNFRWFYRKILKIVFLV